MKPTGLLATAVIAFIIAVAIVVAPRYLAEQAGSANRLRIPVAVYKVDWSGQSAPEKTVDERVVPGSPESKCNADYGRRFAERMLTTSSEVSVGARIVSIEVQYSENRVAWNIGVDRKTDEVVRGGAGGAFANLADAEAKTLASLSNAAPGHDPSKGWLSCSVFVRVQNVNPPGTTFSAHYVWDDAAGKWNYWNGLVQRQ
jgi:hypothetical protein